MTNDPKLLQRVAETYFHGKENYSYLLALANKGAGRGKRKAVTVTEAHTIPETDFESADNSPEPIPEYETEHETVTQQEN